MDNVVPRSAPVYPKSVHSTFAVQAIDSKLTSGIVRQNCNRGACFIPSRCNPTVIPNNPEPQNAPGDDLAAYPRYPLSMTDIQPLHLHLVSDATGETLNVASRLQTYTEKGRNMLDLLVAKLGIPLEEAQRSYVGEGCEWQPAPGPMLSCRLRSGRGLGFVHPTPSPASLADPSPLPPLFLATALHCRRRHGAAVPAQPAGEAGSARARLPPLRCHLQVVPVTGGWVG